MDRLDDLDLNHLADLRWCWWWLWASMTATRFTAMPPCGDGSPSWLFARDNRSGDLIALIPDDGSRISNDQIKAALEQEAGEPISDAELKEIVCVQGVDSHCARPTPQGRLKVCPARPWRLR